MCDINVHGKVTYITHVHRKDTTVPTANNPLMTILEEMSQENSNATSALAKLGKLLYSIPTMNPNEVAVLWHLLEVCRPNATSTQSKEIVRVVQTSLWARMGQILYEEISSKSRGHGDVSQILEIRKANTLPKKGFWHRILSAA